VAGKKPRNLGRLPGEGAFRAGLGRLGKDFWRQGVADGKAGRCKSHRQESEKGAPHKTGGVWRESKTMDGKIQIGTRP
jgi:hypothetical protein